MVESGQLGFIEPFNNRQNCGVHKPHIGVGVAVANLSHTLVIGWEEILNAVSTAANVVQESHQDTWMKASVDPIVHLNEHGRWNDE